MRNGYGKLNIELNIFFFWNKLEIFCMEGENI